MVEGLKKTSLYIFPNSNIHLVSTMCQMLEIKATKVWSPHHWGGGEGNSNVTPLQGDDELTGMSRMQWKRGPRAPIYIRVIRQRNQNCLLKDEK